MSKQSEAKDKQHYVEKPVPKVCGNCRHYTSEIVTRKNFNFGCTNILTEEKAKRCSVGGFAVKKTATCEDFSMGTGK